MNRKGIDFTLVQIEPGLWKWRFQIGEAVTTGKTKTRLMGMASHRAQQRIDRELGKPRDLPPAPPGSAGWVVAVGETQLVSRDLAAAESPDAP